MAKDPAARYQSAQDLAAEVQRFLSGGLVEAYRYRFFEHLSRFVARHRVAVGTAAASLALLVSIMAAATAWNLRERRRAEREAKLATQVSDFLEDLFKELDPARGGATTTAKELLEAGTTKIDRELEGQPLLQARLWQTVGTILRDLGLHDKAEGLLRKALSTRQELLGDDHVDIAASLSSLASVLGKKGRYDEAEQLCRQALAMRQRLLARIIRERR
jgi:serine/threonine-protein kinase